MLYIVGPQNNFTAKVLSDGFNVGVEVESLQLNYIKLVAAKGFKNYSFKRFAEVSLDIVWSSGEQDVVKIPKRGCGQRYAQDFEVNLGEKRFRDSLNRAGVLGGAEREYGYRVSCLHKSYAHVKGGQSSTVHWREWRFMR